MGNQLGYPSNSPPFMDRFFYPIAVVVVVVIIAVLIISPLILAVAIPAVIAALCVIGAYKAVKGIKKIGLKKYRKIRASYNSR